MVGFTDAMHSAASQVQQLFSSGLRSSSRSAMRMVKQCIPQMSYEMHKGSSGRVCVIGGSVEYTGAPYFSAISAVKTGADLGFVVCDPTAAPVIKSYSPELIVYPSLEDGAFQTLLDPLFGRVHSTVLGPGLGRNPSLAKLITAFFEKARERQLPMVIDADGLHFFSENPDLFRGYKRLVLTPNAVEFKRLYEATIGRAPEEGNLDGAVMQLAQELKNVTIVRKGFRDVISDGVSTLQCDVPNSPRRCGGQGDLLTGAMATFLHWTYDRLSDKAKATENSYSATLLSAFAACSLTRECNRLAYQKFSRSTTTSDMIREIQCAFSNLFD
ncbi:ATP dependent (S) NAD(P)H hydrate dehydratase [Trichuris trichiura]|uniref:ATP-dependent (S)-NAD(P)H-hydrate dehydratase n=1 Tax=Trichuris trichiura TaxID=36087 RepID=A0A077Z2E0_TRITR|nr:ATP dependent (S) NAD(P)H hydrate dehydratase [Trichuris trichiura]